MSDVAGIGPGGDLDLTAAEYVIGTLDAQERAAFSARLSTDAHATQAVAQWEARFADLADGIAPVAPPTTVWGLLARSIERDRLQVIEGGRLGAQDISPALRRSRNRWRAAAIVASGLAAALAVFVIGRPITNVGPDLSYVAAINRGGDKPALLVRVDLKTRQVYVRPVAAEAPSGKSLELWYIGDGKAPRSMGVVEATPATVEMPAGAKDAAATFAISVEPPGGSKTGGPTGPVVYSGQLVKVQGP